MSDLTDLRADLERADTVEPEHLILLLLLLERVDAPLRETVKSVRQIEDRLLLVDELPAEALFGALIRLRTGTVGQRAALYLGNGPGQPLSKLVPVAV